MVTSPEKASTIRHMSPMVGLFFTTASNHEAPNVHSYDWIEAPSIADAKLALRKKHNFQIKDIYTNSEYKKAAAND
jgi:hypothetical protein